MLEVTDLHVSYRDSQETVHAVQGISFRAAPGEKVAIIGRSGSGKSSLLRVLSGLVSPTKGHFQVKDQLVGPDDSLDRSYYEQVGLVFQNYGLVPQLTALQNVTTGALHERHPLGHMARFGDDDRQRAADILQGLGLGERTHLRASRLSGGEQQRVAIARLLYQAPSLMLLDEPVASLDVHWAATAMDKLAQLAPAHTTMVMVLHDLHMARQVADRVIYMKDGIIAFDGDPDTACKLMESDSHGHAPMADGSIEVHGPPLGGDRDELDELLPPEAAPPASEVPPPTSAVSPTAPALGGLWGRTSFYGFLILVAAGLYIWAALGVDFSVARIFTNLEHAVDFGDRMFPPDFSVTSTVASSIIETIQMALIGTTLAAILSLPLAVMAARNVSAKPVQAGARLILNGLRTIPSIIWGLFFVAIVGLGPFPGILALTFYAAGYLGKFYYEGIESIDDGPLKSLRTVGASRLQIFRWGVFPQVLPLMVGYTLYMFEYNVRAASILGIVGAGGIGFYLYTYINNFQYDRAATALLILLVVVTLIDSASSRLRARLMD